MNDTRKHLLFTALLLLALTLLCGTAFAELQGTGTESDPILLSSILSGTKIPQGAFYYMNDLPHDVYVYTDSNLLDLYFCDEATAPYDGAEPAECTPGANGLLEPGQKTTFEWAVDSSSRNSHGELPKYGYYGLSDYRLGGIENPIKISSLKDGDKVPYTPYAYYPPETEEYYNEYYYFNDLYYPFYIFSDWNVADMYICPTMSCDIIYSYPVWKVEKKEVFRWVTSKNTYNKMPVVRFCPPGVPMTGDSMNPVLLISLLSISVLTAAAALLGKKRLLNR